MPADEVSTGSDVDAARVRTGPRHAAPKKPLFTRFHMPAGKAIAIAAMPTAVLMGMGFTPTLANAEDQPTSKSLTADEYKDCIAALAESTESADATATPSASVSESASEDADDTAEPTATATAGSDSGSGDSSSSDSGSDDEATPTPSASASKETSSSDSSSDDTATATPSASESSAGLLETIGDAITDILTGGSSDDSTATASPTPSASASASATEDTSSGSDDTSDTAKDTAENVADAAEEAAKDTTDAATEAAEDATDAATDAATATPSPSASSTTSAEDCPVATDAVGDVDNAVDLPDDPWYLDASSLLLKGADYKGVVKVKTANGTVKEVLKYVVSDGVDIGDLHQTVKDKQSGKTYHVQAGEGTTSTFRDGDVVMYTESISGNLFGLIPITFTPDSPPPLNIPLIYFTNVKVVQAGQFGGTLHIPGLHSYITD